MTQLDYIDEQLSEFGIQEEAILGGKLLILPEEKELFLNKARLVDFFRQVKYDIVALDSRIKNLETACQKLLEEFLTLRNAVFGVEKSMTLISQAQARTASITDLNSVSDVLLARYSDIYKGLCDMRAAIYAIQEQLMEKEEKNHEAKRPEPI